VGEAVQVAVGMVLVRDVFAQVQLLQAAREKELENRQLCASVLVRALPLLVMFSSHKPVPFKSMGYGDAPGNKDDHNEKDTRLFRMVTRSAPRLVAHQKGQAALIS
jgi:hypothetical protein